MPSRVLPSLATAAVAVTTLLAGAPPAHAVADTDPPVVNIDPGFSYPVGTILGSDEGNIAALLTWKQYDASGICGRSATFVEDRTGRTFDLGITPTQTSYAFTALVPWSIENITIESVTMTTTDCAGNSSTTRTGLHGTQLAQQSAFALSAGWKTAACRCWSGGGVVASTRIGATATLQFTGSSVALIGVKGAGRGRADIYVDGRRVSQVNALDTGAGANRVVVANRRFPTYGTHVLKVVTTTTAKFEIDAVVTN